MSELTQGKSRVDLLSIDDVFVDCGAAGGGFPLESLTPPDIERCEQDAALRLKGVAQSVEAGDTEIIHVGGGRFQIVAAEVAERFRQFRREAEASLEQIKPFSDALAPYLENHCFAFSPSDRLVGARFAKFLGLDPLQISWVGFGDGEEKLRILKNIREKDAVLLLGLHREPAEQFMRLIQTADAMVKQGSARHLRWICPYYGYGRQDRIEDDEREPLTARLVAKLAEQAGVSECMMMDPHSSNIAGFFKKAPARVYGSATLVPAICETSDLSNAVFVGADRSAAQRAEKFARLAVAYCGHYKIAHSISADSLEKWRNPDTGVVTRPSEMRAAFKGKRVFLIDDMVTTAGTGVSAATMVLDQGAEAVEFVATHGVLVKGGWRALEQAPIDRCYFSTSVPAMRPLDGKFIPCDASEILADGFVRLLVGGSVKALRRSVFGRDGERLYVGKGSDKVEHTTARGDLDDIRRFDPND